MKPSVPAFFAIGISAIATVFAGEPVDAVLFVQNHVPSEFEQSLLDFGDRVSTALSGDIFNVIDPNDAVGDNMNRSPDGEKMPQSAATRLAENLGAKALITASIGEASVVGFGTPARVQAVRMTLTLSAKKLPKGSNAASVTVSEMSPKMTPDALSQNGAAVYSELIGRLVAKASAQFLEKSGKINWNDIDVKLVEVGFGCNFPGADVSIDGVSYGTAGTIGQPPLKVKVSEGIHNVRVSYPYTDPYEVRARLQEGTTFIVVLHESEDGRRIRKEDRHFDAIMDRIEKSGATDDEVRLLRARGYGAYLSSSHTRVEGMPQILTMVDCEIPEFGLDPGMAADDVKTATGDLIDAAATLIGAPATTGGEDE
ncbi:MAG: PEGA domain-containing protein [Kiritimatiellae bacterium]|nr:PEGA domain-containing protein [Kiritimatiellia bacterium]